MKITKEEALQLLAPLIENKLFKIQKETVYYNNMVFGNSYILLQSSNGMIVEFKKDKGFLSCHLGVKDKPLYLYNIEHIFAVLDIPLSAKPNNFLDMLRIYSIEIMKNFNKICDTLYSKTNREKLSKKINQLSKGEKERKLNKSSYTEKILIIKELSRELLILFESNNKKNDLIYNYIDDLKKIINYLNSSKEEEKVILSSVLVKINKRFSHFGRSKDKNIFHKNLEKEKKLLLEIVNTIIMT